MRTAVRLKIASAFLFFFIVRISVAPAYEPPEYPQQEASLESIEVHVPAEIQAGDDIQVTFNLTLKRASEEAARLFAYFVREGHVIHVVTFETDRPLRAGSATRLGPYGVDSSELPGGRYRVVAGMYGEVLTAGASMVVEGEVPERPPLIINTGTFIDKHGVPHRWHVNQAHTLFWNGRPYFPVGGMMIPDHNFDAFKAQIDLLVENNVRDVYLNVGSSVQIPRTWETKSDEQMRLFQRYVDYMDEAGMRYGMQPSGLQAHGFGFDLMGGDNVEVIVNDDGEPALKQHHNDRWIEEGHLHVARHRIRDSFYLIVKQEEGRVLGHGKAEVRRDERPGPDDKPRGEHDLVVRIPLPETEAGTAYTVHLTVARRFDTWNHNMHFWGEDTKNYFQAMRDLYSKVRMGPGFRFVVDVFWNENNMDHNFLPWEPDFRERHERWLKERYGRIEAMHEAWKLDNAADVPDFATAAHLVPIRWVDDAATGKTWAYLIDMKSGRLTRCLHDAGQYRYDILESIGHQVRDYHIEMADLFKSMHDVPVIFKNFSGMDFWHINDAGVSGGFDGLGMESYGVGEPILKFMGISTFGECRQATKTMWLVVTELGEGNHQDQAPAQNKLFGTTSRLGTMYPTYASMLSGGAKGIFHYYMMPSPGVQRFWDDAPSRDPRQLEWLGTFAKLVENAPGLADYAPTVYYRYPGLFHPNSGLLFSDPHRDYTNTDTLWWVDPAGKLPNGAWLLPTFTLNIESDMVFVNLEDKPATLRFGPEALEHVKAGRRVTWLGYRRDHGTLPEIDRYYTDTYAENDDGVRFQVLDPPAGSRVIGRNASGQVWNLIHDNLQIISKDARNVTGWRPDRVVLPEGRAYDYQKFLRDVLGAELIVPGDGLEGITFLEDDERVTVISLAADRNNVVRLGDKIPPYTQDGTGNAIAPVEMAPRDLTFHVPAGGRVTATYPDGTRIGPAADGKLGVTLEPDRLDLISSNRRYDWAPEGLLFDTRATRASVILRSPASGGPMMPGGAADSDPPALPGTVLIEAERPIDSNFNMNVFSGLPELSGDSLLGLASASPPPAPDGYQATYEFNAPQDGVYQLWVREGYLAMASPGRWKVNDGPWNEASNALVPRDIRLAAFYNALEDERMIFAWYHYGQVELTAGTHRLTYSVVDRRPGGLDIGLANNTPYGKLLDCFVLTLHAFEPAGRDVRRGIRTGVTPKNAHAVNLLVNPSLEQDVGGWTASEWTDDRWRWFELRDDHGWDRDFWWTRKAPAAGRIQIQGLMDIGGLTARHSYAGVRSLRIRAGDNPRRFVAAPVPVTPGEKIVFGGFLRSDDLQSGAELRVRLRDAMGNELNVVTTRSLRGVTHWRHIESSALMVPQDAATAELECHVQPGDSGTAWFDDIYLYVRG